MPDADASSHVPVMLQEAVALLKVRPGGFYVDATVGAGGHAAAIAEQLDGQGHLLALDRDPFAVSLAAKRLENFPNVRVMRGNYRELERWLDMIGWTGIDGLLIDAGVSSMQIDTPDRGFSVQADGPLDMRMDPDQPMSARHLLAGISETSLEKILRDFGDVKMAKRIARRILHARDHGHLASTGDLARAVREALPFVSSGVPDEVRQVFQAIRIAVNDELGALEACLESAVSRLKPGGRIVAIAFHSGEDRVIKRIFRKYARPRVEREPDGRTRRVWHPILREITDSPLRPSSDEVSVNPRSASARMRAAEKLPETQGENRS
ncbi:MAG TPA: 16S rRNA (cytosine(1402)-N(4))-methyltransferase RsmH [Candidatus Hydrogenedentes bacterium]|nr:16S rRNA (cytosine(1402)-N(4))-methyltransferase RsmH [Candidatus Hydrogenedentota bacterium]